MQRGHDKGQDRVVLKGSTDNYTILDKVFFASKKLWYEGPHPQTVVMEKTTSLLPCICQGPSELFCYLYISKSSIPNVMEAKFISGILHQCLLSPLKYPALVICFTIPMTQNVLLSLPLLSLSLLARSNQPARSRTNATSPMKPLMNP